MTQTPTLGTLIHVALPSSYGAHAGICRPAFVCEVLSEQYVYAHVLISPSDLAEMPLTDAHTRVPHWAGFHDARRLPDTWHWPDECPNAMERAKQKAQEKAKKP